MSELLPLQTSAGDLCNAALRECGWLGVGQTAQAGDLQAAQARLQWMLQQWQTKRWLVYHLRNLVKVSTGAESYSVGPAGDFSTGTSLASARPEKIEGAYLRQLTQGSPNNVDNPLNLLQSFEDYNRIRIKSLVSFPQAVFYDPAYPLGRVYFWPVPQATIYSMTILIREQLPLAFATQGTVFSLPFEYYNAILYNLALRLRSYFRIPTIPGDPLPGLAQDALSALRPSNSAIAALSLPAEVSRGGLYNIFSDTNY